MSKSLVQKSMPPKPYLVLGNRMFILSIVVLLLSAYIYDVGEAFVAVEVAIIHFLFNLKFGSARSTILGAIYPLIMTLIAVQLSLVAWPYTPYLCTAFVFILVLFERDTHHRGVPKYILPLSFLFLSMMMPVDIPASELILQRSASVVIGIAAAIFASVFVWPNESFKSSEPELGSQSASSGNMPQTPTHQLGAVDFKYSARKALGVGLILLLGFIDRTGAALGAYLFMMIHSPISKNLAPKAWQRLSGTVIGAVAYLPLGLLLGDLESSLAVTVVVWSFVILSLYMILVFLEHNYTLAAAFIMLLILIIAVGPFNLELVDAVFMQRFWYTLIGGGVMVALGVLVPIHDKEVA